MLIKICFYFAIIMVFDRTHFTGTDYSRLMITSDQLKLDVVDIASTNDRSDYHIEKTIYIQLPKFIGDAAFHTRVTLRRIIHD